MRSWILLIFTTIITTAASAQDYESLYQRVDEALEHFPEYVAKRESRIATALEVYRKEEDPARKYDKAFALYDLYRPFVNDSAMFFLKECVLLAHEIGDRSKEVYCGALLSLHCSKVGMYNEALEMLDSINIHGADKIALGTYYEAYKNVYNELAYYTSLDDFKEKYHTKANEYDKQMLVNLPADNPSCMLSRESAAMYGGDS